MVNGHLSPSRPSTRDASRIPNIAQGESPRPTTRGSARPVTGCSEHLAGLRPKSPPVLPPLVTSKHLSREELERHIHQVYTAAVDKKKKVRAQNESAARKQDEQMRSSGTRMQRTDAEIQEIFQRVGEEQVRLKNLADEQLLKRYEQDYKAHNQLHINRPLSPPRSGEPADVVQRMYRYATEHEKDVTAKLVRMYCPPKISPRRTRAQIAEAANRLWRNEKR